MSQVPKGPWDPFLSARVAFEAVAVGSKTGLPGATVHPQRLNRPVHAVATELQPGRDAGDPPIARESQIVYI